MDEFIINDNEMNYENYVTQNDMSSKEREGIIEAHYQVNTDRLYKGDDDMQASAFRNAYTSYEKEYKALMGNKRVLRDDNKEMKDVKTALLKLNQAFYTIIPDDDDEFDAELQKMKANYEDLIDKCKMYINTHPGDRSFFGKGRIRKRMVTNLKIRAKAEFEKLDKRANNLHDQAKGRHDGRPTWINVLAEARVKPVDLSIKEKYKIKPIEQDFSAVLEIKDDDNNTFYIKDMEVYQNMQTKSSYIWQSKSLSTGQFYTLTEIPIMRALNQILLKEDNNEPGFNLLNSLLECKKKDPKLKDLPLNEFLMDKAGWDVVELIFGTYFDLNDSCAKILQERKLDMDKLFDNKEFICKYLTQFLSSKVLKTNCENGKISNGANLSKRNVATSRLAKLFGIGDLVMSSEIVRYQKNGEWREGILTQKAQGTPFSNFVNEENNISPETMLDFNTIELFDIICGQVDRKPNNLMVERNPNSFKISRPICINNDYSFGKLKYKDVAYNTIGRSNPFEVKGGLCRLQFLDKDVVEKLKGIMENEETIRYELIDLLDKDEIECLLDRIRGVLKTIERTKKKNNNFLVKRDKVDNDTKKLYRKQVSFVNKDGDQMLGVLDGNVNLN